MSELKARKFFEAVPTSKKGFYQPGAFVNGYLKSEADKVIADLTYKLQNESKVLKETQEYLTEFQKAHRQCVDNAVKVIAHQKYKRCMAMAKWCARYLRWVEEEFGASPYYNYYERWHNRWLELAEKFKPNEEAK